MELSRKIVLLRERKGWSQTDLAKAAGIPQPTVCRIEAGDIKQPKMATLMRIARTLGVSSDYLGSDDYHITQTRPPALAVKPRRIVVTEKQE